MGQRVLLSCYGLAWSTALPFLRLSKRLRTGMRQRLAPPDWLDAPVDVWIQAASGGESYLAWEICKRLSELDGTETYRVLCTTGTSQGMEILEKALAWRRESGHGPELVARYLPFDKPGFMLRGLAQARPKVVVLIETELWPGLLSACALSGVPVVVVNGRMTERSCRGYGRIRRFFRNVSPERILAISREDADRFGRVFGQERSSVMHNIKFDRVAAEATVESGEGLLAGIVPEGAEFVVLGSVREPEEPDIEILLDALRRHRPQANIGLFPRHMHRVAHWEQALERGGFAWQKRSQVREPASPGTVILWDTFGELGAAYGLARAAFVGGSLRDLGGQNFLEPLSHGVAPVIGPSWSNFAWVGQEMVDQGLLRVTQDAAEAAQALLQGLEQPESKESVRARFTRFLEPRRGGGAQAAHLITGYLQP